MVRLVIVGKGCSRPVILLPIWPYQTLPDFSPPMLNGLVVLVWWAGHLPLLTMSPFWVRPPAGILLPNITTAQNT